MTTQRTSPPAEPDAAVADSADRRPSFVRAALESWGANLLGAGLSLFNVLAVSRALGPSGRGNVAFLTTMAGLTAWIAMFGVPRAVANFAPESRKRLPALAGTSLVLSLASGAFGIGAVTLLVAVVPAAGGHVSPALRWLALGSVPILIFQYSLVQLARAYYGHRVANLMWLITPVVNVTVNGSLALAGVLTVGVAVGSWVVGQLLTTVVVLVYVVRHVTRFGAADARLGRRMLGFGIKAHAGQVLLAGNFRMDQWIVQAVAGSAELGLYSVAVAWSEALFFLPTAFQAVLRPELVRQSPAGARERAATIFRASFVITLVVAGALVVLAPFLCTTIFGQAFRGSVGQLQVLAIGGFGITALKLLGDALTSQSKPLLEMAAIMVSFVVVLVLDIILIPSHGGMGAAIASAIAYSAGGVAVAVIFSRALGGHLGELLPRGTELVPLWRRLVSRRAAQR